MSVCVRGFGCSSESFWLGTQVLTPLKIPITITIGEPKYASTEYKKLKRSLPSVSVVMPCFNAASHVERALQSVLQQTIPVAEVICIDDGSTDDTLTVLERYRKRYPDLICVKSGPHSGSATTRNKGLARSAAEFVQFLDADDRILPGKLERQLGLVAAHMDKPDIVAGSFLRLSLDGRARYYHPQFPDPWANLITSSLGVTSANLWRRQAMLSAGGWNEQQTSSQEYELMFRLLQQGSCALLDHVPLTEKIETEGSITNSTGRPNSNRRKAILNFILLRKAIEKYLVDKGLLSDALCGIYHETMHTYLKKYYPYDPDYTVKQHNEIFPKDYRLKLSDGLGVRAFDDLRASEIRFPADSIEQAGS